MAIKINMEKAKEIHIERWRKVREPLLKKLDIEHLKLTENGPIVLKGSAKEEKILLITKKKQELRDVTAVKLEGIETPEKLSEFWPECLGEKPDYNNG